ncbi:MAG: hypothetical protein R3F40_06770 [Candidatus Competibacteraceae bacterium]
MTATWALPELLGYLRSWSATGRYLPRAARIGERSGGGTHAVLGRSIHPAAGNLAAVLAGGPGLKMSK